MKIPVKRAVRRSARRVISRLLIAKGTANAQRLGSLIGACTFCDAVNSASRKNAAISAVCKRTMMPNSPKVFCSERASRVAGPRCSMNFQAAQKSAEIRTSNPKKRFNCRVDVL